MSSSWKYVFRLVRQSLIMARVQHVWKKLELLINVFFFLFKSISMKFRRIIGNINGIYFNNNSFDLTYFHTSLNHKIISFSYRNVQSFTSQFFQQPFVHFIRSKLSTLILLHIFSNPPRLILSICIYKYTQEYIQASPHPSFDRIVPRETTNWTRRGGGGKWWPGFGESISCPSKGRPISRGDKTEGGEGPY